MSLHSSKLSFTALTVLIIMLLSSCVGTNHFTDKAILDRDEAKVAINEISESGLLVLLPTQRRKEEVLENSNQTSKLAELRSRRKLINATIVSAFKDSFDFAEVYFMPDSLYKKYEKGEERVFFVNGNLELDESITYETDEPYKIFLYDFRYIECSQGQSLIPNPFPNRHDLGYYATDLSFLQNIFFGGHKWSEENLAKKVGRYNKRLYKYYKKSNKTK